MLTTTIFYGCIVNTSMLKIFKSRQKQMFDIIKTSLEIVLTDHNNFCAK